MIKRFRGESVHKVDAKGRVSVPAPFRRVLEEGDPDWSKDANPNFVLVFGAAQGVCVEGYSLEAMQGIDDMISDLDPYSEEREALEYMFHTDSANAHVDENGRIVLPARAREILGDVKEAVFAGAGEKFQIWNPEAFAEHRAKVRTRLSATNPLAALRKKRPDA